MILVEPQYLPSVNYFKNIGKDEIVVDINSDYVNKNLEENTFFSSKERNIDKKQLLVFIAPRVV